MASRRELERRLNAQGWVLIALICSVTVIGAALFRKGVLTPKDLLADA
jgi:hypothetical protein